MGYETCWECSGPDTWSCVAGCPRHMCNAHAWTRAGNRDAVLAGRLVPDGLFYCRRHRGLGHVTVTPPKPLLCSCEHRYSQHEDVTFPEAGVTDRCCMVHDCFCTDYDGPDSIDAPPPAASWPPSRLADLFA